MSVSSSDTNTPLQRHGTESSTAGLSVILQNSDNHHPHLLSPRNKTEEEEEEAPTSGLGGIIYQQAKEIFVPNDAKDIARRRTRNAQLRQEMQNISNRALNLLVSCRQNKSRQPENEQLLEILIKKMAATVPEWQEKWREAEESIEHDQFLTRMVILNEAIKTKIRYYVPKVEGLAIAIRKREVFDPLKHTPNEIETAKLVAKALDRKNGTDNVIVSDDDDDDDDDEVKTSGLGSMKQKMMDKVGANTIEDVYRAQRRYTKHMNSYRAIKTLVNAALKDTQISENKTVLDQLQQEISANEKKWMAQYQAEAGAIKEMKLTSLVELTELIKKKVTETNNRRMVIEVAIEKKQAYDPVKYSQAAATNTLFQYAKDFVGVNSEKTMQEAKLVANTLNCENNETSTAGLDAVLQKVKETVKRNTADDNVTAQLAYHTGIGKNKSLRKQALLLRDKARSSSSSSSNKTAIEQLITDLDTYLKQWDVQYQLAVHSMKQKNHLTKLVTLTEIVNKKAQEVETHLVALDASIKNGLDYNLTTKSSISSTPIADLGNDESSTSGFFQGVKDFVGANSEKAIQEAKDNFTTEKERVEPLRREMLDVINSTATASNKTALEKLHKAYESKTVGFVMNKADDATTAANGQKKLNAMVNLTNEMKQLTDKTERTFRGIQQAIKEDTVYNPAKHDQAATKTYAEQRICSHCGKQKL